MEKCKNNVSYVWRNLSITVLCLTAVTALSLGLSIFDGSDSYTPMLFVFAVFIISRYSDGYFLGIISSIIGVILVNFIFTYPYFEFNFSISGYPVTFICMFGTSLMTCAMTARIKQQERIRIEAEKERMQVVLMQEKIRMEAEKEKMRGNLLRAVSHDLRTPLTSIIGTTSALIDSGDKISPEQQRQLLQESHDDAVWLVRMVENLLSVTRISGETRITKIPEAAEEIVGEVLRTFSKRFPEAQVSVSVPDELLMIPMDAMLIEQVLVNLLENAVIHGKSTDNISLTVEAMDNKAVFRVSDNGAGIAENVLDHLFDGYFTGADGAAGEEKRNMGIGLSLCHTIVQAHGGTMDAHNEAGGGAVFRFILPMEEQKDNEIKNSYC